MTLLSWSTRRPGCAASMPRSASTTTSFGSLINFFIRVSFRSQRVLEGSDGADLTRLGGLRFGVAQVQPGSRDGTVSRGAGEQAVQQGGDGSGEELGREVHRELVPLHLAARELLDEHGTHGTSRVDGRAGGRSDRDDG